MGYACRRRTGSFLLALAAAATACGGDDLVGPDTGTLEVTSSTTGVELDVDGYSLQIDGGPAQPLGPNATVRRTGLTAGTHTVLLDGVAANCSVEGERSRAIAVVAGQTAGVTFSVTCSPTAGNLRITSTTSGSTPDPDGYTVTVDGADRGSLAPSGEITLAGLTSGEHTVGIGGVSGNCQVQGDNPRTLTITAGSISEVAFAITCQAPPQSTGTLRVTTTTTGSGADPDGYAFTVDAAGTQPIGANATVTVASLAAGPHTLQLTGLADQCTVSGLNPRAVTVPTGGTVETTFSVSCESTVGSLEVTTTTTGSNGDPDGYTFAVDNGSGQPIGANAAVTVADITVGVHSVRLSGVAANCAVQGTNPRNVTVTRGGTATAGFAISCTAGSIMITTNPPVSALSREVFDPVVQPVVQVKDGSGNPVSGAEVTARIATGSGTLEGKTTATSDANGQAAFADLGIRGAGDHVLEFAAGAATVTSSPIEVSALPAEAATGKWGPLVNWDIVPLHMTLLPTGKIFAWGKTDVADTMGMPRIWDPSRGSPTGASELHVDEMLFCSGHTLMPDGRLMVSGGHLQDDRGIPATNFFTPDGGWQKGPDMAHGRWYPTVTVLADGRLLTMAGRDQSNRVVTVPEIWENGRWAELPGAGTLEIPYYPRNFVDPRNGMIFNASERIRSRWFDPDGTGAGGGRGSWINGPSHIFGFNRDYGSAVMYDAGRILVVGGGGHTSWPTPDPKTNQPTATAEVINLNQASPSWQSTGSMAFRRRHMNATILPDGQVLATGGTRGGGFVNIDRGLAVREAEIWNPSTGQWTTLASNSVMRIYHSVSLLLPDGTVLHGASGDAMAGATPVPPERSHEIFSPPYLFKGARPRITSAPSSVGYGETFSVVTPNAAQVTGVRWIRLGSVTHAFDASQRANTLSFEIGGGRLQVEVPSRASLAPPGHYLLFILNRNGVPSTGKVVRVGG